MSHHQHVSTGFQCAEANAEQHCCGECVVVDEAAALSIAVMSVQGQVGISVTRVEHWTEIDLQCDGLHTTVHSDIPLSFR